MAHLKSILRTLINPLKLLLQSKAERRHELVGPASLWKMKRDFQMTFLKNAGLLPEHYLIDIGCGTLRGGVPLIDYLEKAHYFGIESRSDALDEARKELLESGLDWKNPTLYLSKDIAKLEINNKFDYAWSFSVLIHMSDRILNDCFYFASRHLLDEGVMYANVNIGNHTDEKWQGFPVVYRSLDFYIEAGFKNGLRVSDLGTLKSFGHITGIETQDIQRMLRITKIIPTTTVN